MTKVLPVIHHLNHRLSVDQLKLAQEAGADGVFLISHNGKDDELLDVLIEEKAINDFYIGINFLGMSDPVRAYNTAATAGADAVWLDDAGVSSTHTEFGMKLRDARNARAGREDIFASVAFKYQGHEPNPVQAAFNARSLGFIPTTSGPGTGQAPEVSKVRDMSVNGKGTLAIASGMTPENIGLFVPYLTHVLVATGVSVDMHNFDYEKLRVLIAKCHAPTLTDVVKMSNPKCIYPKCGCLDGFCQAPA